MDSNMRTARRAGTHACGDTPCGGASAPSNVSQKQESPAFRHGERQDVLVSLPGWENSEGARLERLVAEACGIETCNLSEVEGAS